MVKLILHRAVHRFEATSPFQLSSFSLTLRRRARHLRAGHTQTAKRARPVSSRNPVLLSSTQRCTQHPISYSPSFRYHSSRLLPPVFYIDSETCLPILVATSSASVQHSTCHLVQSFVPLSGSHLLYRVSSSALIGPHPRRHSLDPLATISLSRMFRNRKGIMAPQCVYFTGNLAHFVRLFFKLLPSICTDG